VSVAEFVICRVERRRLDLIARYLELSIAIAAERGWITSAPRGRATAP
jgi:hypothetical protein